MDNPGLTLATLPAPIYAVVTTEAPRIRTGQAVRAAWWHNKVVGYDVALDTGETLYFHTADVLLAQGGTAQLPAEPPAAPAIGPLRSLTPLLAQMDRAHTPLPVPDLPWPARLFSVMRAAIRGVA